MNIKRYLIVLACMLSVAFPPTKATQGDDVFELDIVSFLSDNGIDLEEEMKISTVIKSAAASAAEEDIEYAFWNRGHGARTRDPLFLIPQRRLIFDEHTLCVYPFYNSSLKMPGSPNLILDWNAVAAFKTFADLGTGPQQKAKLEAAFRLLPYIRKMTIQEHRAGTMLSLGVKRKRLLFQLETCLLMVARNYWLNNADQADVKAILEELEFDSGGKPYKIRFGLGDTRLRLGYQMLDTKRIKCAGGIEAIVPTSAIGRKRKKATIKTVPGRSERKDMISDLLNIAPDILIDPKLGMGHWGLGCFFDFKVNLIPDRFDVWGRLAFDYMFSKHEHRYMPSEKGVTEQEFAKLAASTTVPASFPIEYFFPQLAKARISPGHIFNATLGSTYKFNKKISFGLGYDFFYQQKEAIKNICVNLVDKDSIKLKGVVSKALVQHKVFGDICYKKKNWAFGLGGDIALDSAGAAKDWTISGKIGIKF